MTFDFSPFYRSTVGFDRLFDMADRIANVETGWPPYNIERVAEDQYRITMAVAGFGADDIEMVQQQAALIVSGRKAEAESPQYLHRGIAARPFRQTFELADHVKVVAADLHNGLLTIDLKREVPEALKPRKITIGGGQAERPQLTHKAA